MNDSSLSSIDAMQAEIGYQLEDLLAMPLPAAAEDCLFAGSGDSYVAGLAARCISCSAGAPASQALCCHPADIVASPAITRGRNVFIISISGRTAANILAAKAARKQGAHVTAITAATHSRSSALAKECDAVIELQYRSAGRATAGTISFSASLLACSAVAADTGCPGNLRSLYSQAERNSETIVRNGAGRGGKERKDGAYIMLGNNALFPAAAYGSLKLNEVLGASAFAYQAEEFCHSPLFGLAGNERILVMGSRMRSTGRGGKEENKDNAANFERRLARRLAYAGFNSTFVNFGTRGRNETVELVMQSVFFVQLLALKLAKKRGISDCYFLSNKTLLGISSDFIYYRQPRGRRQLQ